MLHASNVDSTLRHLLENFCHVGSVFPPIGANDARPITSLSRRLMNELPAPKICPNCRSLFDSNAELMNLKLIATAVITFIVLLLLLIFIIRFVNSVVFWIAF